MLLAFLMIPVIQKQLDSFRQTVWNTHRIRTQKDTFLPDGVPEHIYEFPEKYGLEDCGQYYCNRIESHILIIANLFLLTDPVFHILW